MSKETKQDSSDQSLGSELVIPVTAMAFAVYYVQSIWNLPWEAQMNGFFLSAVIMVLGLAFIARSLKRRVADGARFGFESLIGSGAVTLQRLGLVGLTIGYILVLPWLGFTATTCVFLIGAMTLLGARSWKLLAGISMGLSLTGYVVFIVALNSRLPHGVFEKLMAPLASLVS